MVDPELDELRREFLAETVAKVREIEEKAGGDRSAQSIERLTYLAHQLKGSGGSYGFERISAEAAEIEKIAERIAAGDDVASLGEKLRQHAESLRAEVEQRSKELG